MAADHMHTNLRNSAIDEQRCPFCHLEPGRIFVSNEHAVAVLDGFPVNPGHNFVLAHSTCNRSKRDFLAARCHLEKWQKRNHVHGTTLGQEFDAQGILHNRKATEKIAIWAYSQAEAASANLWLRKDDVSPIDPGWRDVLSAAL